MEPGQKRIMEPWQEKMLDTMTSDVSQCIVEWGNIVNELGMEEVERDDWVETFHQTYKEFLRDIVKDVYDSKNELLDNIDALMEKGTKLYKELGMQIPEFGEQNLGLYKEEMNLRNRVFELEKIKSQRQREIDLLKAKQVQVCHDLGKELFPIKESPFPTEEEINSYKNIIDAMDNEIKSRQNEFKKIRFELIDLVDELKTTPSLDYERMILYGDADSFAVTDTNMKLLNNFRESLLQQVENVRNEIFDLREKVIHLWDLLSDCNKSCDNFLQNFTGTSLDTLEALKKEVKRCELIRKDNIKMLVERLRTDLLNMWDKCMFSMEQRQFEPISDTLYTEDLISSHEYEIQKLNRFYNENKNIYDLLNEREALWAKLIELEERATAPNRFKNRGGQLLKEEKERNVVFKKIPLIEEKLLQLTATYEVNNKTPFLYWGQPMEQVISNNLEKYEENKKLKQSARKMIREVKPANKGSVTNIFPSTFSLARSTINNNGTRNTPIKPIRNTPLKSNYLTPNNKRVASGEKNKKGLKSAPSKMSSSVVKPTLRYSIEKKRRMDKLRRISKLIHENKKAGDPQYEMFENELSTRGSCRSTLFMKPTITVTTPGSTKLRIGTPKKLLSTPKVKGTFTATKLTMDI